MRRILMILTAAAAASAFAGCGGGGGTDNEIVIWEQKDPEEQVLMVKQISEFMQAHPGIKVTTAHFETDQLHSQFQTAALAGGGPDLVYGPSDKIGPYSVMELIKPLESLFEKDFFDGFEKQSLAVLDGHIYAVPDQIGNHLMLIYNKAFVKKEPADSGEWIEMCVKLTGDTNGDGFPDRYGLVFNSVEPFWLVPFLGGFGGWVIDAENNPTLDTPAMTAALRFMYDLRNKYGILPKECNYELSDTMFKKGQGAFIINGPWSLKAYLKAGLDIGVTPIPRIKETGRMPTPMVSSKGYSISVNVGAKKLDIVKELAVFLTSREVQKEIVSELLILPSRSSLFEDAVLLDNPILRGSMAQARNGRAMSNVPEMRAIWDAMRPYYQSALSGGIAPAEAARQMQEKAIKKIEEMKR